MKGKYHLGDDIYLSLDSCIEGAVFLRAGKKGQRIQLIYLKPENIEAFMETLRRIQKNRQLEKAS